MAENALYPELPPTVEALSDNSYESTRRQSFRHMHPDLVEMVDVRVLAQV